MGDVVFGRDSSLYRVMRSSAGCGLWMEGGFLKGTYAPLLGALGAVLRFGFAIPGLLIGSPSCYVG